MEMPRDPSPETNLSAPKGSRRAAEAALGPSRRWAERLMSLAAWPASLLLMAHLVVPVASPHPSARGLALGVVVAAALGYAIGLRMPRALAHVRRMPLVVLATAAGGLGACVATIAIGAALLASPHLANAEGWLLGGASFGLAYGALLLVPTLLERLGKLPRSVFALAHGGAIAVATFYAAWVA